MRHRSSMLMLALVAVAPTGGGSLLAQDQDTSAAVIPLAAPPPPLPHRAAPMRWWHGAIMAGGISALALLDEPARQWVQDHRSGPLDHAASVVRPLGETKVYLGLTAGLLAAGVVSQHPKLTNAGSRLATTLLLTSASVTGMKWAMGRPRPGEPRLDSDDFVPFSGRTSMPSGHTTLAFAFATELADDIHRPWATAGLYTFATAVGWSRLNDDRHWLSDVGAGAALGIVTAKVVDGRWRVFNLRPPRIGFDSRHFTVGWHGAF